MSEYVMKKFKITRLRVISLEVSKILLKKIIYHKILWNIGKHRVDKRNFQKLSDRYVSARIHKIDHKLDAAQKTIEFRNNFADFGKKIIQFWFYPRTVILLISVSFIFVSNYPCISSEKEFVCDCLDIYLNKTYFLGLWLLRISKENESKWLKIVWTI